MVAVYITFNEYNFTQGGISNKEFALLDTGKSAPSNTFSF